MNVALHTIECFAGVGMLGVGLHAGLGHLGVETRTVCYVEREAFAASVMAARMAEGALDDAPVWTDVTSFDATAWRGSVDCVIGGFPCQDLSLAGRRAGLDGKRSGLFFDLLRIAEDSGARYLFLENVAGIASATATVVDEAEGELEERAAARVLGELADRGWNAEWLTLSASDVGASHGRARWFCWAWRCMDNSPGTRCDGARQWPATDDKGGKCLFGAGCSDLGNTECSRRPTAGSGHAIHAGRELEPGCCDVAHSQRAERRPVSVCGTGGEQGHDGGRRETHGGSGITDEVLGHTGLQYQHVQQWEDGAELTRTDIGLGDPEGHGRHQGRPEPGGIEGRPDAAECCGAVADTQRLDCERRGISGDMARTRGAAEDQTRQREWSGPSADSSGQPVAHTSSPRQQGREQCRTCLGNRGGGGSTWTS